VIEEDASKDHPEDDRQDQTERRENYSSDGHALAFGVYTKSAKHDTNQADETSTPKADRAAQGQDAEHQ